MEEDNEEYNRAIMESLHQFAARNRLQFDIQVPNARDIQKESINEIISVMDATVEGDINVISDEIIRLTLCSENADVDLVVASQYLEEFLAPVHHAAPELRRNDSEPVEHISTIDVSVLGNQVEAFGTDIIEVLSDRLIHAMQAKSLMSNSNLSLIAEL